jgi:nitrite reductase (NO-forming)
MVVITVSHFRQVNVSSRKLEVPGKFMLVDHALTRVERGLVGILEVTGPENPNIFKDHDPAKSAQSMSH